jgi:hemoglobin
LNRSGKIHVEEATMKRHHRMCLWTLVVFVALGSAARAQGQQIEKSLYDRLGGAYNIAVVVDDFIDRLLANATLNANPAINEARSRVPAPGLKFHVTTMVCEATGGPCKYVGRDMKTAHAKLNITQREWDAMVADFRKTLNKFKVPVKEQEELIQIVGSTKKDIVVGAR